MLAGNMVASAGHEVHVTNRLFCGSPQNLQLFGGTAIWAGGSATALAISPGAHPAPAPPITLGKS